MKILLVQNIYNEISLLPWKMGWIEANGFESFTWDNYSTDGSYEWLKDRGYRVARYYTNDMFSLQINNRNVMDTIHRFEDEPPDWVIEAGADMFYGVIRDGVMHNNVREFIEWVDRQGYTLINCSRLWNFYYTGTEDDAHDPRLEYRHYREANDFEVCLMAKYDRSLWINGDQFVRKPGDERYNGRELVTLHYWLRSDAKVRRVEHFLRRQRAWEHGIDRDCHGVHYRQLLEKDKWVWDKKELQVLGSMKWDGIY